MILWISGFFQNEKIHQEKEKDDDTAALVLLPSGKNLELLLKNDYFLKKKVTIIEEFILPLHPKGSFLLSATTNMSASNNESIDSFQEISPIPSRTPTPSLEKYKDNKDDKEYEEVNKEEVKEQEEAKEKVEEQRLSKYKVLIDPMTGERALYRRIDEQTSSAMDGDWIIGLGDGRFLIIGAWPVLIASNILVFALGFYFHSATAP